MLDIGLGLFEVSNISKLGAECMNPEYTCYVICLEVTHMLGDGRVGMHRRKYDVIDSVKSCSKIIWAFSMYFHVLEKLS